MNGTADLMASTLGYAILAVLARNPSTGYELAARLATPVSYFWTARHSQIHPELQRLLADGLVAFEAVPGPGPKGKKVYSITPEGFEPLRQWVAKPPPDQPVRDELVLRPARPGWPTLASSSPCSTSRPPPIGNGWRVTRRTCAAWRRGSAARHRSPSASPARTRPSAVA
jgi:DNA-binding PadR family transcriptional regulator